jgi:uncharacterized protein (DUF1015 family)
VADVQPFRAERYAEAIAGPLERLVAPPYDVISPVEREAFLAKSPHNVVHLTLPDSEEQAARELAGWRAGGVLERDEEPAFWALEQEYVGPDEVRRTRRGLVGSLRVEPYEKRVVLPHERTHAGPKEGRLRLLRATRTQLEPIFLLYEGSVAYEQPSAPPDVEAEGARLWRMSDGDAITAVLADKPLLIADGHHRYETALAFHDEDGSPASARMMVVLVSTSDPGLMIFPTHRVAERFEPNGLRATDGDPLAVLRELQERAAPVPALVVYSGGRTLVAEGEPGELDTRLVERLGPEGVSYTPRAEEAVAAVDEGRAQAAFLLRPTRIEDVFAVAERGETMPQKSTYFYPKLPSGVLFHPL